MRSTFKSRNSAYDSNANFTEYATRIALRDLETTPNKTDVKIKNAAEISPKVEKKVDQPATPIEEITSTNNGIDIAKEQRTAKKKFSLTEVHQFLLEHNAVDTEIPLSKIVFPPGMSTGQKNKLLGNMVVKGHVRFIRPGGRSNIYKIVKNESGT